MPKFSLRDGNTLQYDNGKVYYNGNEVNKQTGIFKDKDGYTKKIIPNLLLTNYEIAVQDVDKNGNSIKHKYIGGTTKETREKYWQQAPIVRHAVDSIANRYGISPKILKERLSLEGFVDDNIRNNNNNIDASTYHVLHRPATAGEAFELFGLDDTATMIDEGKVKLKNEEFYTTHNINEEGRLVHTASGRTPLENMGIMAATLKYFRDKAKKDFPKASDKYLDKAASIYYNRGAAGGYKYLKNKKK